MALTGDPKPVKRCRTGTASKRRPGITSRMARIGRPTVRAIRTWPIIGNWTLPSAGKENILKLEQSVEKKPSRQNNTTAVYTSVPS